MPMQACEMAAKHLASFLGTLNERHLLPNAEASQSYRGKVWEDLQKVAEHNTVLLDCIMHGVAFHHAGKTISQTAPPCQP
jgi:replicative superfamily II helicase